MVEFADLFESEAEEFQKKAKVGIRTLIELLQGPSAVGSWLGFALSLRWLHDIKA